jgi:hypothetical protein
MKMKIVISVIGISVLMALTPSAFAISRTKTITEYRTPAKDDTDLVFAVYQNKTFPKPHSLYQDLVRSFAKTLDRMGKAAREDGNERRRQITPFF